MNSQTSHNVANPPLYKTTTGKLTQFFIKLLKNIWAFLWDISQTLFGSNNEKCRIYYDFTKCLPGQRILDFGCATGITASAFKDCQYLGVDISESAIIRAKRKFKNEKNIQFKCCNVFALTGERFDHILCAATGHHLSDTDLLRILKEMKLLLSENGKLHFIDIVKTNKDSLLMRIIYALDRGRFIRTIPLYSELFKNLEGFSIEKECSTRAEGSYTKPTFVYFKLIPS